MCNSSVCYSSFCYFLNYIGHLMPYFSCNYQCNRGYAQEEMDQLASDIFKRKIILYPSFAEIADIL